MLLRFAVSNYRSIASEQVLSLVATKLSGSSKSLIFETASNMQALPSAVIYGANASGKTTLLKAIRLLSMAVQHSHSKGSPDGGVPRSAFALDKTSSTKPTKLEADFIVDGTRYQFGFEADDDKFLAEWLFSYPEGKRRKLYEREGAKVTFGPHFRGAKRTLVDFMRDNSLFISTATQNDHAELSRIASFFRKMYYSDTLSIAGSALNSSFKKNEIDQRTIDFLGRIGTGVAGFRKEEAEVSETQKAMLSEITRVMRRHLGGDIEVRDDEQDGNKSVTIELLHKGASGFETYFELSKESAGTRRIMFLMNHVFRALDQGSLVVIDELDASLHTRAAEAVIDLFSNPAINTKGAQLIATTHDTNFLTSKSLRRDQIWFCEKNKVGASSYSSLSDVKARRSDDFEEGYLQGRYGGVPPVLELDDRSEQVVRI